jgi:hypothetical protein
MQHFNPRCSRCCNRISRNIEVKNNKADMDEMLNVTIGSTEILKFKTVKLTIMDEMLKDVNCTVKM